MTEPTAQEPTPDAPAQEVPPTPPSSPDSFAVSDLGLHSQGTPTKLNEETGIMEMGLDDENIKAYDFELYSGRKGQQDRISIIFPTKIYGANTHYKQNAGYAICNSKFDLKGNIITQAPCCAKESPRKRFAALVVQYGVKADGGLEDPIRFALKLWRFSEDKYVALRQINREFPLTNHDITITCSEEKFQKLSIQASKVCVWRLARFPQAFKDQIQNWATNMAPKAQKALGRKLTEQEWLERLGLATSSATIVGSEASLAELGDLLT